jgi:hypothetical protein
MPDIHEPSDEPTLREDDEPTDDADDQEHRVARRPNPLPSREEDEEELAEADIVEASDLDDEVEDDDDL